MTFAYRYFVSLKFTIPYEPVITISSSFTFVLYPWRVWANVLGFTSIWKLIPRMSVTQIDFRNSLNMQESEVEISSNKLLVNLYTVLPDDEGNTWLNSILNTFQEYRDHYRSRESFHVCHVYRHWNIFICIAAITMQTIVSWYYAYIHRYYICFT